jgi:AcrR family transcriptional regulator
MPNVVQLQDGDSRMSTVPAELAGREAREVGIKERQERERESVRRAILDAARDLFVAEGYQHVSIRKIAERIEYSPAAIYGYFPSKDDIFFALAEEGFDLLHAVARSAPPADDPIDGLRQGLWAFYEFSKRHPEHFLLMFLDRSVPRIGAHYQQFQRLIDLKRRMADVVAACITSGALPASVDPASAFRVLTAALLGATGTRLFNRLAPGEDGDALARDVVETVLGGLRAGVPLSFTAASPELCGGAAEAADAGPEGVPSRR